VASATSSTVAARAGQARKHHVGLEEHAFQGHLLDVELLEDRAKDFLGYLRTSSQSVVAVHEDLGFDDRDEAASWHKAAYLASACALASMQPRWEFRRPGQSRRATWQSVRPSERTEQAFARPSRPSVTFSPGWPARSFAPASTLIPGMIRHRAGL